MWIAGEAQRDLEVIVLGPLGPGEGDTAEGFGGGLLVEIAIEEKHAGRRESKIANRV